ncbi:glucuronide transporter [Allosaccharopolyspora coralli]|uniref:Glucuronide transporter n=1 Tax=Allosaccharopolyspora coralli TaxID=2665642 RepID=A0A5Q3QG04_9PSEU|nr:glucuronide transporter [Allosaccharopolyspora coralli]QGK70465.1 glucuronide transporter [Allosaccharopolyspora coralli]
MKLHPRQIAGYGAGDAANNLAFSMSTMFLLLYYTDVAGIPAVLAGTIFLVVRIWDGVTDLIAGGLVDRSSSRWGKFRPWLLFASLPLLLLSVATFWVPDWGLAGKLIYAYVTYAAMCTAYSFVNIPYGSLAAAMTQDPVERTKLATARSMGYALVALVLAVVVSPQIENSADLQSSLTWTTSVFVVVGFGLYLFTFATAKETVHREVEQVSWKQSVASLRTNRPLILLCLSSLVLLSALFSVQTMGVYYARDVLGNANVYIAIMLAKTGTMFLAAPLAPRIVRRFGKKAGYTGGGVVAIIGFLGITVVPASMLALAIGFFVVSGFGLGLISTLMWSFEADTVEYGEWRTGVRSEGATYAVYSFVRKVGQALGGASASFTIGLAGYVGGASVQTEAAVWGIRLASGLVPALLTVLALAIMVAYPLTEQRFGEITEELRQRRSERGSETSASVSEA